MCRWQLLLERGLDVVGHLQLESSTSPPRVPMAPARVHWLLPLGLRGGASVVSALARPRCALLEQNPVLSNDEDNQHLSVRDARSHRHVAVTTKG